MLNRAAWSPLAVSLVLLRLLPQHLDHGDGPPVFGIDETLERRQGPQINALGVYRDAARSSHSYTVKASGLRRVAELMWLGHIPWAGRYWALPFLTVLAPSELAPSERYHQKQGRRHQKLIRLGPWRQTFRSKSAIPAPPAPSGEGDRWYSLPARPGPCRPDPDRAALNSQIPLRSLASFCRPPLPRP